MKLIRWRKNKPICLIGAKYKVFDSNYNEIEIQIGNDENESTVIGQSSTQNAKAHVLHFENEFSLRIIDTAGIGDTRGKYYHLRF